MPGIRHEREFGNIVVSRVYKSEYQKDDTLTAELKQEVITTSFYPTKTTSNEFNDSVYDNDDFGFEEQEFESTETRVAWILVPSGTKLKEVAKRIAKMEKAVLYRLLSNKPIISKDQAYAIGQGRITKDQIAMSQVIRYPEEDYNGNPHEQASELITDNNGNVQYRKIFFSKDGTKKDKDTRSADPESIYVPEELEQELADGYEPVDAVIDDNQEVD